MRGLAAFSCLIAVLGAARADEGGPPRGFLAGRIVDGETLVGLDGATVVATDSSGGALVVSGSTDRDGRFRYALPAGRYDLLAVFADARWLRRGVAVTVGATTTVAGVLSIGAETVTIHEHPPAPPQPAKVDWTTTGTPPYSEEAIDGNYWSVGWFLLDVDEHGVVTGFKFLHRPGHDLDDIATQQIWKLRFQPARDGNGAPVATHVLWKLEWPAYHWAKQHAYYDLGGQGALMSALQENRLVDTGQADPNMRGTFVLPGEHKPPCKSFAPLNQDLNEPIYRDCSPPDLGAVNTEPEIMRPR